MSDEYVHRAPDRRMEALAEEFIELSTQDQELVMAVVARLRAPIAEPDPEFPRAVSFMDFDE